MFVKASVGRGGAVDDEDWLFPRGPAPAAGSEVGDAMIEVLGYCRK